MIESIQSLGLDKFRVAFTRFLAFYSDNPSGLHEGETPAKWQSKAIFATHPSTEPEWPPKLLRADVSKNQTLAGNSQKIDFAHTFKFDTLSC